MPRMISKCALRKAGSFGFEVSVRALGALNFAAIDAGTFERRAYCSMTRRTSATVVGSGKVGPLARADSRPSGTSVIARVIFAALGAAAAKRPPFTAERCLRTELISDRKSGPE